MGHQRWTAIVLTCSNKHYAYAYQKELETRQLKGLISRDALVLTVEDPEARIGSGGATLNALLVVTEHLSAKAGYTVVASDVLKEARILIMHMGRTYPYDACGRAFVTLPLHRHDSKPSSSSLVCNFDQLYDQMTANIAADSPPGVWVCSTDMMLTIPCNSQPAINWGGISQAEVVAITVPSSYSEACQHGVYDIDDQGYIKDILYQRSGEQLLAHARPDHKFNLAVGIAFFSVRVTEKLLSFHAMTPLDCCTYIGIDRGARALELSLFFDILYAMCSSSSSRGCRACSSQGAGDDGSSVSSHVWSLLKKHLGSIRAKAVSLEDRRYYYLGSSAGSLERALSSLRDATGSGGSSGCYPYSYSANVHGFCEAADAVGATIANSYIGRDATIGRSASLVHCVLTGRVTVGSGTWLKGVHIDGSQDSRRVVFGDDLIVQKISVRVKSVDAPAVDVHVILGRTDDIQCINPERFCNKPLTELYERTGLTREHLWPATPPSESTLLNAKLYPVLHPSSRVTLFDVLWMQNAGAQARPQELDKWKCTWRFSLEEILSMVDLDAEFAWRQQAFVKTAHEMIADTLLYGRHRSLTSLYSAICAQEKESYAQDTLLRLDSVASSCSSPGVAARTLANIADLLGSMAAGSGGLRSGPAANAAWQSGFALLEEGRIADGVAALAAERRKWLKRPDHLIRAARHYEGAAQILIRHAVMSARQFVKPKPTESMVPIGQWVVGESPVRIDIAGGWSDTPPITYEHGGAVTNAAILVDGKWPVGAKVRRIKEPQIVLLTSSSGDSSSLVLTEMRQLEDYYQPQAPGALVKAALFCASVLEETGSAGNVDGSASADSASDDRLREQLLTRYSGGFELHTWSDLPQGSGLGTSSILAGVVMAVLWRITGQAYSDQDIIHAVLHLEQMLTTGGGWQDQVGGLLGGIRIGESEAALPLYVTSRALNTPAGFLEAFNDRLVLVYTGRTRLAKNLLQNVVRNWYARDEYIVKAQDELVRVAHQCADAFEKGDLDEVGRCWELYWVLKKQLATGCEPEVVSRMMATLRPHVHSAVLAGAGGGGFMYVLAKETDALNTIRRVLTEASMMPDSISLHKAEVTLEGLRVYTEQ